MPAEVRDLLLRKYLPARDVMTVCQIDRKSRARLRNTCITMYLKKTCNLFNEDLSWISFVPETIDPDKKMKNLVRDLKLCSRPKELANPESDLGCEEIKYSSSKNECCYGNILHISSAITSSKLFVLTDRMIKVYAMETANKLRPVQMGFHEWTDFVAVKGVLKPSKEGSFVLVWRWGPCELAAPTGTNLSDA